MSPKKISNININNDGGVIPSTEGIINANVLRMSKHNGATGGILLQHTEQFWARTTTEIDRDELIAELNRIWDLMQGRKQLENFKSPVIINRAPFQFELLKKGSTN